MQHQPRLEWALLLLRLSVFYVMMIWVLDKFIDPDHAVAVASHFYGLGLGASGPMIIGVVQGAIMVAFVLGLFKFWTYGAVFVMHAVSTLATYASLINPWAEGSSMLFPTAVPMLAAIFALWLLRDHDTKFTLGK